MEWDFMFLISFCQRIAMQICQRPIRGDFMYLILFKMSSELTIVFDFEKLKKISNLDYLKVNKRKNLLKKNKKFKSKLRIKRNYHHQENLQILFKNFQIDPKN